MESIKISVVVPIYNAEKYIGRAIDSVLEQTYPNWELILVNDGSTDESESVCRTYARDERIRLVSQKNQGVCAARNTGISQVTGDVIVFMDADDFFCAEAFEIIARQWDINTEFLMFGYNEVHENGETLQRTALKFIEEGVGQARVNIQMLMCRTDDWGAPWGKVFSKRILLNNQILFVDGVFLNEDRLFNLQYLKQVKNVKYIDNPIYFYCLSDDSVTSKVFEAEDSRLIENFNKCCEYLSDVYRDEDEQNLVLHFKLMCMKMILWWVSSVSDSECRKSGEDFCYKCGKEIQLGDVQLNSLVDKVILKLCCGKQFGLLRIPIKVRKKIKAALGKR